MRFAWLILTCCSCWAQLPVIPLPLLASGAAPPPIQFATNGLAYRWVSSDLANNTAISGNWTDRVQGVSWLQGASSLQPTNSSTGVWTDSTHYLTNNGLTVSSNCSFGFIVDVIDPGNYSSVLQPSIIDGFLPGNADSLSLGFSGSSSAIHPLTSVSAGSTFHDLTLDPFPSTNAICDIVYTQAITNGTGVGQVRGYTNSIVTGGSADNFAFNTGSGNINYWGSLASPFTSANSVPRMYGRNSFRTSGPKMFTREIWIWTNHVGSTGLLLDDQTRTNFHKYATNTYPFSP